MKKKKKQEYTDDSWLYTILLSTIVILASSLKNYTFTIKSVTLTYSLFLLPLIFLLTNYITKKYDFRKSVSAICLSSVALVIYTYAIFTALGKTVNIQIIGGELSGYLISQLVNLYIYKFLLVNTTSPKLLVFLNYMFSFITFYMFYTLINLNILVNDNYWKGYFITLIMQGIECIFITLIDDKIKRGYEE